MSEEPILQGVTRVPFAFIGCAIMVSITGEPLTPLYLILFGLGFALMDVLLWLLIRFASRYRIVRKDSA